MAIVRPYRSYRVKKEFAKDIASLPYDVVNSSEVKEEISKNKKSFLRIIRAEGEFENINSSDEKVYKKAKENLGNFLNEYYIEEEKPIYYIYEEKTDTHTQRGIVATFSADDYKNDIIKKHEKTREEKEKDRIKHFDVLNANTEPVFLTYKSRNEIKNVISDFIDKNNPIFSFEKFDIKNSLYKISDEKIISHLENEFSKVDSLYIADGHHRAKSSFEVAIKRRNEKSNYTGDEEFNFFMGVLIPDDEIKIIDYNRVVFNVKEKDKVLERIEENFKVEKVEKNSFSPDCFHNFGMYFDNSWYKLIAKEKIITDKELPESLDVQILSDYIITPILNIKDLRRDKNIDFIGGTRGLKYLEKLADEKDGIAFSLFPVKMKDIEDVSDKGDIMPPKSTWFIPKLISGLFIHTL